jgi:hypothetical protein
MVIQIMVTVRPAVAQSQRAGTAPLITMRLTVIRAAPPLLRPKRSMT